MRNWIIIGLSLFTLNSFAQKEVFLTISPKIGGNPLEIGPVFVDLSGKSFNLDHFNYYLSDLHLIHDGGQDLDLSDTVFLVRSSNFILDLGNLNVTSIEQVNFATGVPANLNTDAGADAVDISVYPHGHPLGFQDPSMYWGWTAGYMHMIIGGLADTDNDGVPNEAFEIHTVGDNNYKHVQLPIVQTNTNSTQIDIFLDCNVDFWIKDIDLQTVGILHGSTGPNAETMDNVETEPVFTQPTTASINLLNQSSGSLFFNEGAFSTEIKWSEINNLNSYKLIDINGRVIDSGSCTVNTGSKSYTNLDSGVYFFQLYNDKQQILKELKLMH